MDVAEAELSYARSRHHRDNVRFQHDDALALSFRDNEFDAAVSAYVINFFAEPRHMAAEMKRVVSPSGMVAACTWDFAGNRAVARHIAAAFAARNLSSLRRAAAAQNADSTRLESMERIFRDVGLQDVATISIVTRVKFNDFDDYWQSNADFSSSYSGLMNELTAADRERFKAKQLTMEMSLWVTCGRRLGKNFLTSLQHWSGAVTVRRVDAADVPLA